MTGDISLKKHRLEIKKNNKNYLNSFGIGNNMISSAIQCE